MTLVLTGCWDRKPHFSRPSGPVPLIIKFWTGSAGIVGSFLIESRTVIGVGAKFVKYCHIALARRLMGYGICILAKETICSRHLSSDKLWCANAKTWARTWVIIYGLRNRLLFVWFISLFHYMYNLARPLRWQGLKIGTHLRMGPTATCIRGFFICPHPWISSPLLSAFRSTPPVISSAVPQLLPFRISP